MITINLAQSKAIKYVKSAMGDDVQPILNNMHVSGYVAAADGFRIHATPQPKGTPETPALPDGIYRIDNLPPVKAGQLASIIETPLEMGHQYPDLERPIPRQEPAFSIAVNPLFLREALAGLTGVVVLRFYAPDKAFEVYGELDGGKYDDNIPTYALIMPQRLNNNKTDAHTWRPGS